MSTTANKAAGDGPEGCDAYREAISARVDGEDPGMDAADLDRHVEGCADCQAFLRAATSWRAETTRRAAAGEEDRPELRARILAAIPDRPAPRRALVVIGERGLSAPQLAVAAAVVVIVLVAGFVIGGRIGSGSGTSHSAATASCGVTPPNSIQGVEIAQVAGSTQCDPAYPGATVLPATRSVIKPKVTLTDTSGRSYSVTAETAHRVTLIYFGYTHCPNVCPINMTLTADAIHDMRPALRKDVTVVFITTDPSVDKPAVIRHWLNSFTGIWSGVPSFVGLTGPQSAIHAAERQVGMPLSYVVKGGDVVHAGYTLLYSRSGTARLTVDYTETAANYATTLTNLVTKGFQST